MSEVASLGMIASFFVAHTWQWGDIHLENFGNRAYRICPVNTAIKQGVVTTFHQDSPVLPPDMMHTVWCAVNRITQSGVQLAKDESATVYDALKSITINRAYQYGEEDTKGTIERGKDASFVILTDNPLTCDKLELNKIKVDTTILRGNVVFKL
jgi:predicted amidohydrolase YtcJ